MVLAGYLGFMMNPIRTWKISVSLLTLLCAYGCVISLLYIIAKPVRLDLGRMTGILASLCGAVAFVEVVISSARGRSVNVILVGTALTAFTILILAGSIRIIPYMFHSVSDAFRVFVHFAISLGPTCCLAAATWIGRRKLENYRMGTTDYGRAD
jgi:hypothetical protein